MSVTQFPKRPIRPFTPITPAKWQGLVPKPREWLVDGCFAPGTVAMLSGDGGIGKSLLMLQLQTAAAIGAPWLGLETRQIKSFGYYCEDDEDELHRRQARICEHHRIEPGDLGEHMTLISRVGEEDNVLIEADRHGRVRPTVLYDQLFNYVLHIGAQLIVLDTLADIFDGNEIMRSVARQSVGLLRKIALRTQGCVVVTMHPSVAGMSSGSGMSGSTGWHGAVRERLYLTSMKQGEEDEGTPDRLLKTMKKNYGPHGGKLRLRWRDGVFARVDENGHMGLFDRLATDRTIIEALRSLVANGTMVLASTNQSGSFVNLMRSLPELRDLTFGQMRSAQDRLLDQGKIVRVELGPPSKRRVYLRPSEQRYPGEPAGETE